MTIEVQNFYGVGFEIAFVALKAQCSLLCSGQFEKNILVDFVLHLRKEFSATGYVVVLFTNHRKPVFQWQGFS